MVNYNICALLLSICSYGSLQASLPENAPASSFVVERSSGKAIAIWAADSLVQAAIFNGETWSSPLAISNKGQMSDTPHATVFGNNSAIAIWKSVQGEKQLIQAAAYNGEKWSSPLTILSSDKNIAEPRVAVNKEGRIIFLWNAVNEGDSFIQACVFDGTGLSTPETLSQPGQNAQQPQLSVEEDGKIIATWNVDEGQSQNAQSATFDGVKWTWRGWSSPTSKPELPPTKTQLADIAPEEEPAEPPVATTPSDVPEETPSEPEEPVDNIDMQPCSEEDITIEPIECEEGFIYCPCRGDEIVLFGNVSYFRPNSGLLRQVYDNAWVKYDIMLMHPIWENIYATEIVGYTGNNDGHSLGGHQRTRIHIVPVSIGINYLYMYEDFDFYVGIGPRYFFLNIINHSDFVKKHDSKNGIGGFASLGVNYHLCHFVFDFFADYSYKRFDFHKNREGVQRESLQVGGISIGGGLGYQF